jgi:hypothetical protein
VAMLEELSARALTTTHVLGAAGVAFANGSQRIVRFFASCVDGSGAARVTAVLDLRPEATARIMRDHFEQLGGVPDVATFDERPATLFVRPALRGPSRWDASIVGAMRSIGVELEVRRRDGMRPLEQEVVATFFDGQRFSDERDLDAKLASWCDFLALQRVARSGEHARLKPLHVGPDAFAVPVEVRIATSGVVYLDGHCYVVPAAAGTRGTALMYPSVIRVVAGGRETLLPRRPMSLEPTKPLTLDRAPRRAAGPRR